MLENYEDLNVKCYKTGNMECSVQNNKFILNVKCQIEAPYYNETKGKLSVNITGASYLDTDQDFVLKARLLDRLLRDKVFDLQNLKIDDSLVYSINIYVYVLSHNKNLLDYIFEALKQYLQIYPLKQNVELTQDKLAELDNSYIQTIEMNSHVLEVGVYNDKYAFINKVSNSELPEDYILDMLKNVKKLNIKTNIDKVDLL